MNVQDVITGHYIAAFAFAATVFIDALCTDDLFAADMHVLGGERIHLLLNQPHHSCV